MIVIARMLGVPEAEAPRLLRWSHAMVAMYQARRDRAVEDAAVTAATEFSAFVGELIDARRAEPGEDLLSSLIAAEEDGAHLSRAELISTVILLLNAGHEATVHAIGNGAAALVAHGLGAKIGAASSTGALTDEILRWDPPLHMFTRYALEDIEVFGHHFARGEIVGLMLASANRDERVFERASEFVPDRGKGPAPCAWGGAAFLRRRTDRTARDRQCAANALCAAPGPRLKRRDGHCRPLPFSRPKSACGDRSDIPGVSPRRPESPHGQALAKSKAKCTARRRFAVPDLGCECVFTPTVDLEENREMLRTILSTAGT